MAKVPVEKIDALPKWQLGWIGGILDGEGCLRINKPPPNSTYYEPQVRVSNTSKVMVGLLQSITHLGTLTTSKRSTHKQIWEWRISAYGDVYLLLSRVKKYLAVKRRQADIITDYCADHIADGFCNGAVYYQKLQTIIMEDNRG